MKMTLLGTGDVRQVPVYGCECEACEGARADSRFRRRPCSALLEEAGFRCLVDAGLTDLGERFAPGSLNAILLTHYHVDHVQGLFHLRWGMGPPIPVFGPSDPAGCADLFKHPGMLDFQPPLIPFHAFTLGQTRIIPLPLNHSRPTLGYLIDLGGTFNAYLTDTCGLPQDTLTFLQECQIDTLVIDCSRPPSDKPGNHNSLTQVLEIQACLEIERTVLTHVGHECDHWLMRHPLPPKLVIGRDGMEL